jgi:hypothetical protein
LTGLARQPYFDKASGALVTEPGYAARSGILAAFSPSDYALPEPTEASARAALAELLSLIGEFHFDSEADRSAAVCAMLTAAVRGSLPLAPAFSISASSPGSGKSYLANVIAPFAGPGDPLNVSYPTSNEEATKVVVSLLIGQPAVVCFDDMPTDWLPHGAINRMLTSEHLSERMLGSSRVVTASSATFVMGTGNNVRPVRDLGRRVVTIYLTPPTQSVTDLRYQGRPAERVRAERARFVGHALTIIRAWQAAGRPTEDVPTVPSYGTWSDLCRQPLLWLGLDDPAKSLIEQVQHDPDLQLLGDLLSAWHSKSGSKPIMLRELISMAERSPALDEALHELPVIERDNVNRSKLGWYLKRNANRIVNGYQLKRTPTGERNAWTVVPIGSAPPTVVELLELTEPAPEQAWLKADRPPVQHASSAAHGGLF